MTLAQKLRRIPDVLSNPIVIKELRQAVRSRFIAAVLLLFLFVQVVGTGIVLLSSTFTLSFSASMINAGRDLFHTLLSILSAACLLCIPLYTGIRMAVERSGENLDLLFITTISPGKIIRGKFFAGAILTVLLFSASLPFMSVSYLLRGIDLLSIFVVLVVVFLVVLAVLQGALFLACFPMSRIFKSVLALAFLGGIFSILISLNLLAADMTRSGIGSLLTDPDFWKSAGIFLLIMFLGLGFLHVLSVTIITPAAANRALMVRLFVTGSWLICGAMVTSIAFSEKDSDILLFWLVPSILLLAVALLTAISEPEQISTRVRRMIPHRRRFRFLFLFYTGAAGGVTWVVCLATATLLLSLWAAYSIPSKTLHVDFFEVHEMYTGVFLYMMAYAMTTVFIRRLFLKKLLPEASTWVLALLIIAAAATLPVITAALIKKWSWDDMGWWHLANMFALNDDIYRHRYLMFASGWCVAGILFNLSWFAGQVRAFKPVKPAAHQTPDTPA